MPQTLTSHNASCIQPVKMNSYRSALAGGVLCLFTGIDWLNAALNIVSNIDRNIDSHFICNGFAIWMQYPISTSGGAVSAIVHKH